MNNHARTETRIMAEDEAGSAWAQRLTRRTMLKRLGGLGAMVLGIGSVPASVRAAPLPPTLPATAYGSEVATTWFRLALRLVRQTPGYSPPVASRAFGYLGVTLYEALVPGLPGFQSLAGQLHDLSPTPGPRDHAYHWPSVANSALATITRQLFPTAFSANRGAIDALETEFTTMYAAMLPPGITARSVERGQAVAAHIFAWSVRDGGHEGYLHNFPTTYSSPVGPGLWVPTPPAFQRALQPFWGQNRPFVLTSGAECDPGPPPAFSTDSASQFYASAIEVYDTVNHLTDEQREITLFWADDPGLTATPPGHSLSILTQVLEERDADLATAAEAFARAGMAVADAFISCWHSKYTYHLIRPITYIREHIDADWGNPLPVTTPPFPEYTSGHSVQAAAFAQVLFDLFGDFPFTDHTHDAHGLGARSFTSWVEMAEEVAISRLYGGIHFRPAIERGVEQGKQIGRRVNALRYRL